MSSFSFLHTDLNKNMWHWSVTGSSGETGSASTLTLSALFKLPSLTKVECTFHLRAAATFLIFNKVFVMKSCLPNQLLLFEEAVIRGPGNAHAGPGSLGQLAQHCQLEQTTTLAPRDQQSVNASCQTGVLGYTVCTQPKVLQLSASREKTFHHSARWKVTHKTIFSCNIQTSFINRSLTRVSSNMRTISTSAATSYVLLLLWTVTLTLMSFLCGSECDLKDKEKYEL